MAQRVINEIRTNFTETGAAKTAKATDQVGKAQTRLGQASASAGRQFSAQSQGLGGIVSAYAGAAANVFAITAAFFALRRAAEFEQIVSGTNALASSIGASGTEIVESVQEITKAQLSLLDTVQQVNLALVSGFNTQQIEQLSDVSLRASKALGRNLGDAFARIVRGAAKLEPELLDELGIFTRIDPAVRKYADSVGVSVSSLTNFERRQAFVNAVIEEGLTKYRDVDVGTRTAAESLQTLAARVVDVGLKFGAALATGIAPFADFISDKGSNVLAAFGILARVIGAQALAVLDAGVAKTAASIANFGDRGALAVNNLSGAFKKAAADAQQAASQVALTRFGTETEKSSKRAAAAILEEVAAGKVLTRSKTELAVATLNEAKAAEISFQTRSKSVANNKAATASIQQLTVAINALNTQQKAGVVGANLFSSALTKLAGAARFAGAAVSKVFGFVTTAITALSIFQLVADGLLQVFGIDIVDTFEPIINFFKEFIDNLTMGKKGVQGLSASVQDDLISATAAFGALGREAEKAIGEAQEALADYSRFLFGQGILDKGLRNLFGFQELKDDASAAGAALRVLLKEIERLGGGSDKANIAGLLGIERVAAQTGIATSKFIDLVNATQSVDSPFGLFVDQAGNLIVLLDGVETQITRINEKTKAVEFIEGFEKAGGILTAFNQKNAQFADDFEQGLLTAERAAAAIGAQNNLILQLQKEIAVQRKLENFAAERTLITEIEKLKLQRNLNQATAQNIALGEKQAKIFEKIFGKPGEKLDLLSEQGAITDEGGNVRFLLTAREKISQQAQNLVNRIKEANDAESKGSPKLADQLEQRKNIQQLIELGSAALRNDNLTTKEKLGFNQQLERDKKRLVDLDSEIEALNSNILNQIKQRKLDEQAILLIKQKLLETVDKEVFDLQKQSRKLAEQQLQFENKIADIREKRQLGALKQQLAIVKQLNEFNQNILGSAGISTEQAQLAAAIQEGRIQVTIATKQEEADIARANRQFDLDFLKLQNDKKNFEFTNKLAQTQITATIELIDAIEFNSKTNEALLQQAGSSIPKRQKRGNVSGGLLSQAADLERLGNDITTKQNEIFEQRRIALGEQFALQVENAENTKKLATQSAIFRIAQEKFEANQRVKVFKAVNEAINTQLKSGVEDFFQAIADGTLTFQNFKDGFKQFLFDTFEAVRKAILEETLIKPLQEGATNFLADAFGLDGLKQKSIDDAVVSAGSGAAVRVVCDSGAKLDAEVVAEANEKSKSFFDTISTKFEEFKEKGMNAFDTLLQFFKDGVDGLGSFVSSALSGIGSFLGDLGGSGNGPFTFLSSLFASGSGSPSAVPDPNLVSLPMASGGLVRKFAAGGMQRDRVPALLEPGEFVVRKPAVQAAGGMGAMQQLNATGQMGGPPVSINVTNEGQPKEAEQQGPPKFDGDKMVVDIVLRDLRTNGPIRRAMRGGDAQ